VNVAPGDPVGRSVTGGEPQPASTAGSSRAAVTAATAPAPDPGESVEDQSKIMIDQAIRCYLAEHKHDAENTLKRYGYIMDKVRAYSEHKGFRFVEQ